MRFLFLDTYYPKFLSEFYRDATNLPEEYAGRHQALMDECFGTSDYYSTHLKALGHEATEIIGNDERLQRQWAIEHAPALATPRGHWSVIRRKGIIPWPKYQTDERWTYEVLAAQVADYQPDILYVQDINWTDAAFLKEMKGKVKKIIGQIACPLRADADLSPYDMILTSFPHFVERFKAQGIESKYFRIGFEPKVLERLTHDQQRHRVVFAGGLSGDHADRIRLLNAISDRQAIDLWGYGAEALEVGSSLRKRHHGPAWGLGMYQVLYNADIALNYHINVAGQYANNMRLYEATGVGAMLITDYKTNLGDLFEVGQEVVAYRSEAECVEMIDYYATHEVERAQIAKAGQARTLREHSYAQRMQELDELVCALV